MEVDSDSSFAPSCSLSTTVSSTDHTDTRLSDISAADGSATTSSSAAVAAAASIVLTSSTSPSFDSSTPSRKRKRSVDNWQKGKQKLLRNSGKEYVTNSKKNVSFCMRSKHGNNTTPVFLYYNRFRPENAITNPCGCPLKCYDKISLHWFLVQQLL